MKSIYLSKKDVARKLNISPSTVVRWSKSNIIPMPFSLGNNKIVWDETELNQAIEERKKHKHKVFKQMCTLSSILPISPNK